MRLLSIASAAAIAAAALTVTPDAFAQRNRNNQATTSVVINYQRVLAESALGRDMQTKLGQLRQQFGTEAQTLEPEQQSLAQERERLAGVTRNMNADQIRSNSQVQQFTQRMQQLEGRAQTLRGDLECSQLLALRDFDRQVSPIVRSVMESRGAGVVLDASNVQLVLPEFDITNTVIQQLDQNQGTRTATVARHAMAECAPQQAAAPQQPPAQ